MDHVRELQSVELALEQAKERGDEDTVAVFEDELPGKVAAVRAELARLEANPPTYGSADYVQDADPVARAREALAKYDEEQGQDAGAPAAAKRGRAPRKENTADSKPKETA